MQPNGFKDFESTIGLSSWASLIFIKDRSTLESESGYAEEAFEKVSITAPRTTSTGLSVTWM